MYMLSTICDTGFCSIVEVINGLMIVDRESDERSSELVMDIRRVLNPSNTREGGKVFESMRANLFLVSGKIC